MAQGWEVSEVGVHRKDTEECQGFPFNVCVEWDCALHGLSSRAVELALRLEGTLRFATSAPVLLMWEQDCVEATSRKLAKGTREKVMELVVHGPFVQVLPEPQVHVSLLLPFFEQIVDVLVQCSRNVSSHWTFHKSSSRSWK